jgi:uncharacterized protein
MWFVLLALGVVLFVAQAIYFSGRMARAVAAVAPRAARPARTARIAYLVVGCSMPVLIVLYAIYAAIARPDSISLPIGPVLTYGLVWPFWLLTVHAFQSLLLVLPIDLLHWAARRARLLAGERWTRRRHALALGIAAFFAVQMPWRIARDGSAIEVRAHELPVADLPRDLDGFTIALIADLHLDSVAGPARAAGQVDAVNAAHPDIVLVAGDLISRRPEEMAMAADQVARLRAPHGVYIVIGDHENFAYGDRARSVREMRAALAARGLALPDNQAEVVQVGAARVALLLVTNNYISHIDRATARALLDQARGADLRILVAHQAGERLLEDARAGGVDLFLAGHTHGGQVRFWLPFFDLSPARFETRYLTGEFQLGRMVLVVTSGLGTSVAPFRYRAPATFDLVRVVTARAKR